MSGVTHCRGCGKRIIYVKMPSGKDMPVDLGVQIVELDMDMSSNFVGKIANSNPNVGLAYGLNHFQNCPRAKDFTAAAQEKTHDQLEALDKKSEAAGESHP